MEGDNYIAEIERLNSEYADLCNSREYLLGKRIAQLKNLSPCVIIKKVKRYFQFRTVRQNCARYNFPPEEQILWAKAGSKRIRVAVYTCITGNYDTCLEPYFSSENIDYFLFSDSQIETTIWKYKTIPSELVENYSKSMINRYIKFHPFEFFEKVYDYAIYIDGNVLPISDLSVMCEQINTEIGIAFHSHCSRNCIFEEIKACKILGKGNFTKMQEQITRYRSAGFPAEYGMVEGNVIAVDLKSSSAKSLLDSIWEELAASESGRDQLAIPYILWKNGISVSVVSTLGANVYKNPKVRILQHR